MHPHPEDPRNVSNSCDSLGLPARLAFVLLNHDERARGGGWMHRARRLLDQADVECVERGYLNYCAALSSVLEGDVATGEAGFAAAAETGDRFGDLELVALGLVAAGLRGVQVDTTIQEEVHFASGQDCWTWMLYGNPIVGMILSETSDQDQTAVREVLDGMIREHADSTGTAVLTAALSIGFGWK